MSLIAWDLTQRQEMERRPVDNGLVVIATAAWLRNQSLSSAQWSVSLGAVSVSVKEFVNSGVQHSDTMLFTVTDWIICERVVNCMVNWPTLVVY